MPAATAGGGLCHPEGGIHMRIAVRSPLRAVLVLAGLVGAVTRAGRAQQGTITGRVTDQANGQPLVGARVTVVGTSLVTQTNAEGRYAVSGVPGGQVTLRASAVGFGAASPSAPEERRWSTWRSRWRRTRSMRSW